MATKGAISNQQFKAAQAAVEQDARKRSAEYGRGTIPEAQRNAGLAKDVARFRKECIERGMSAAEFNTRYPNGKV